MARFTLVTPRLPVADIARTMRFYTETLGFEVDLLWPELLPTFLMLQRDDARLQFYTADDDYPGLIGDATLNLEVSDASGVHEQIRGRVRVEWGPEVFTYGRREFAIKDPDGYLVVITEPTDDPPTANEP